MGKIINFPNSCNWKTFYERPGESLAKIKELIWKDPKTYFSLEACCLLGTPLHFEQRKKLRVLNLIDEGGFPMPEVAKIVKSMTALESNVLAVK